MNTKHDCDHVKQFNQLQKEVMIKHLAKHKWYRHIQDDNEAIFSFINEFGGIMREVYCRTCDHKENCAAYEELIERGKI